MTTYTQEDMDKANIIANSVKGTVNRYKSELFYERQEKEDLLNKIFKMGSKELILSAIAGKSLGVYYEAIEGTYINKKGVESKCWNSVYGKYAGSREGKRGDKPIILKSYIKYNNEDFDFIEENEGYEKLKYNKRHFKINGKDVVVAKS